MGLFGFLKKKPKEAEIELPPPPKPPEAAVETHFEEDIPPIRPGMEMPEAAPPEAMPAIPRAQEMPPEMVPEMPMPPPGPSETMQEMPEELPETRYPKEVEEAETVPAKVFDKTVKEFFPKKKEVIRPKEIKPMFVAVDEYKDLASDTKAIRSKLTEAEEYVARLSDLKNQKEKVFDKWRKLLEDTEKKLAYVDSVIEKAQG